MTLNKVTLIINSFHIMFLIAEKTYMWAELTVTFNINEDIIINTYIIKNN